MDGDDEESIPTPESDVDEGELHTESRMDGVCAATLYRMHTTVDMAQPATISVSSRNHLCSRYRRDQMRA